jgi:hypothetical protein
MHAIRLHLTHSTPSVAARSNVHLGSGEYSSPTKYIEEHNLYAYAAPRVPELGTTPHALEFGPRSFLWRSHLLLCDRQGYHSAVAVAEPRGENIERTLNDKRADHDERP